MKKRLFLIIILSVSFLPLTSAATFEFNGTIAYLNRTDINGVLINITVRDINNEIVYYNSTTTNSSGWFNLSLDSNSSWTYQPSIRLKPGTWITHVGQFLESYY